MEKEKRDLFSVEKRLFGGDYESAVIEQWKTCVDAASSITEKRNTANSIFITINTALFAVITFTLDLRSIFLSGIGILISCLWLMLLANYKRLNTVKYDIINEMEELLPLSPFKTEWERLLKDGKYAGLTKIEKTLPVVFLALYGLAILCPLVKLLLPLVCSCVST